VMYHEINHEPAKSIAGPDFTVIAAKSTRDRWRRVETSQARETTKVIPPRLRPPRRNRRPPAIADRPQSIRRRSEAAKEAADRAGRFAAVRRCARTLL